ncbi:MAG: universal stress protein [Alphaproteobacteria bacterium]|nr:MAG: universal stress protein [Alphaproteobacteria bacterium]
MYKTILVPLALEHEGGWAPAIAAAKCLRDPDGRVELLHVIDEVPGFIAAELPPGILERSRSEAEAALKRVADASGLSPKATVLSGHPSRTILDHAEAIGADCIVIISHRPGLEDYFLGSTAARVVRHAPCSVHVIR